MDGAAHAMMRPNRRDLLLPVALVVIQLGFWPIGRWLYGETVTRDGILLAVVSTILVGALLCWRRVAPVGVLFGLTIVHVVVRVVLPWDSLMLVGLADLIAVYSVAVHRRSSVAVASAAGSFAVAMITELVAQAESWATLLTGVLVAGPLYAVVWALGRVRRRWLAQRDAASHQLARAEAERAAAAATERARLSRELHDVAAHHLSSIVVHAGAAERVAARNPAMVDQALEFSAATGRETLESLHELVSVMDVVAGSDRPAVPSLAGASTLVGEFRRLGMPIELAVRDQRPLSQDTELAGLRIIQESLTNALRHAPGLPVRVTISYGDGVLITVENESPLGQVPAAFTDGAGRGIAGMRERAELVGGELTAGPRPTGGWVVRALLPASIPRQVPEPVSTLDRWKLWHWRDHRVLDVLLVVLSVGIPSAAFLLSSATEWVGNGLQIGLTVLLIFAHALPLLWRRQAPWISLGVSTVVLTLWLVLFATDVLPVAGGVAAVLGIVVEIIGVFTVGAARTPIYLTWISVLLATIPVRVVGFGFSLTSLDIPFDLIGIDLDNGPQQVVPAAVTGLLAGSAIAGPLLLAWAIGVSVGVRQRLVTRREERALDAVIAQAAQAASAERARIARGLQGSVLRHTTRLIEIAESGKSGDIEPAAAISQVCVAGREALAAMRDLLGVLRSQSETESSDPIGPQPSLANLAQFSREQLSVSVEGSARALPAEIELSAFHLIEHAVTMHREHGASLGASPTIDGLKPVEVVVHYGPDDLRVSVTGLPAPADERTGHEPFRHLRERVDSVGGRLVVRKDGAHGAVHAWFPAAWSGV